MLITFTFAPDNAPPQPIWADVTLGEFMAIRDLPSKDPDGCLTMAASISQDGPRLPRIFRAGRISNVTPCEGPLLADVERASICLLAAICRIDGADATAASAEVDHRRDLGMTQLAALESVLADLNAGRWVPL